MPEHVHLIVAPRVEGVAVGQFVGRVKESVSRVAVEWLRTHSPQWLTRIRVVEGTKVRHRFWQPGGGYDRVIDNEQTLELMLQYIHQTLCGAVWSTEQRTMSGRVRGGMRVYGPSIWRWIGRCQYLKNSEVSMGELRLCTRGGGWEKERHALLRHALSGRATQRGL